MNKEYWKAILMRAWHAVWETAAATLPATIVITPAMIEHFDKSIFIAIAAWFATALVAGVFSIIKSLAMGIPEASTDDEIDYLENHDELETTKEGLTRQEAADLWLVGAEIDKKPDEEDKGE